MRCAPFVFAAGMVWLEVLGGLWVLEALEDLEVLDVLGGFAYQRFSGKPLICPATRRPATRRPAT